MIYNSFKITKLIITIVKELKIYIKIYIYI